MGCILDIALALLMKTPDASVAVAHSASCHYHSSSNLQKVSSNEKLRNAQWHHIISYSSNSMQWYQRVTHVRQSIIPTCCRTDLRRPAAGVEGSEIKSWFASWKAWIRAALLFPLFLSGILQLQIWWYRLLSQESEKKQNSIKVFFIILFQYNPIW